MEQNKIKSIAWGETISISDNGSFNAFINPNGNSNAGIPNQQDRYTASIIVSAVNACKEINPANPLAAAEQIFNLYEACVEALNLFDNYPVIHECEGTFEVLNNAVNGALKGYFNKG